MFRQTTERNQSATYLRQAGNLQQAAIDYQHHFVTKD